jgi:uncharacterized protein DUF4406
MALEQTGRPTLYISGPMSGLPDCNYPAFREASTALRSEGWNVVDPSEHFGGSTNLPRHKYLAADVVDLITKCKAIALLTGWWTSEGAKLETQIALDLGYELFYWRRRDKALISLTRDWVEDRIDK